MKINEILKEMDAGSVATIGIGLGPMLTRQPKNPDGTAKNALDMGKKKKKRKSKKA
jgi:hypothetical protein